MPEITGMTLPRSGSGSLRNSMPVALPPHVVGTGNTPRRCRVRSRLRCRHAPGRPPASTLILPRIDAEAAGFANKPVVRPGLREQRMAAEIGDQVERPRRLRATGNAGQRIHHHGRRRIARETFGDCAEYEELRPTHFPW